MKIDKIKPIPKYILKRIKALDKKENIIQPSFRRFYSYFTKNDGELVKVTVAVKNKYKGWYAKQVAVHGLNSEECFVKDMDFFSIAGGYVVGWYDEGIQKYPKRYEFGEWWESWDNLFDPYAPCVNKEFILKQKQFKYCAVDKYRYLDIIKYLRQYIKYPIAEMLNKIGLDTLLVKYCLKN